MFGFLLKKILGTKSERDLKRLLPIVAQINEICESYATLSDAELRAKTDEFKQRLGDGEALDDILPDAFAAVKETCRRMLGKTLPVCEVDVTWDMVPFDVQIVGAIILHEGKIAEMVTGEGKTLAATMPLYLNGLTGRGCHLITVNDYLARRDREWMGPIYESLGLSVGCIQHDMSPDQRKEEYLKDITYGTNNEFGFDYLRDNMALSAEGMVQRGHHYAIVDEVDSILIDEARTPLIISGPVEHVPQKYNELRPVVERLVRKQNTLAAGLVKETRELLDKEDGEEQAGINLLLLRMATPKNKGFLRLMEDGKNVRMLRRTESAFMVDKENIPKLQEELFYAMEEATHSLILTEKGRHSMSASDRDMLIVPDRDGKFEEIDGRDGLSEEEKRAAKAEVDVEFQEKSENIDTVRQLLKGYALFEKDVDYVVTDNKVVIVDQFTGRLMPGRRYSDGLHQALEAKENVEVGEVNQTLATITLQNYFRLYEKLAGMTGTAETEAQEFHEIYKLDVVVIPTNEPVIRADNSDVIYKTEREKFKAIADEICDLHEQGRPILVGTVSVEKSERLSQMLKRRRVSHQVLNAKYHQMEAEIVARAGQMGSVTIATNMAGRGTDIKLGEGVTDRGGLHVIGTERHEARRIDNQLRGRSGRQGDPGSSRFYLSLEDNLMRIFGGDRLRGIMETLGVPEDEPIEHHYVTKSIEMAQRRVEQNNLGARKHLLEFDNVMNRQRSAVYEWREEILGSDDPKALLLEMVEDVVEEIVPEYVGRSHHHEEWDVEGLRGWTQDVLGFAPKLEISETTTVTDLGEELKKRIVEAYEERELLNGPDLMSFVVRAEMLRVLDDKWKDHLYAMDYLRESVRLRSYGQVDPLIEYKKEAVAMFDDMVQSVRADTLGSAFRVRFVRPERKRRRAVARDRQSLSAPAANEAAFSMFDRPKASDPAPQPVAPRRVGKKVGRNEPCPCGSGKKYKKCCGG
jgi:preprotein translocase subunit SecA